ncbi:MAG: hypothetical protein M1813_007235 [Trichoglossum hirsutum]|nr:MAG: hypothetical protein M1813_007235 [Trichoglossum hirsutum]
MDDQSDFGQWATWNRNFGVWYKSWVENPALTGTMLSQYPVHRLAEPSPDDISRINNLLNRLLVESLSWKPTVFFQLNWPYNEKEARKGGWGSAEGDKFRLLARQRATSLLKLNQSPLTPRIYPFLGLESYFFHTLDFSVKNVNVWPIQLFPLGSATDQGEERHFLTSAALFISHIHDQASFSYSFNIEDYFDFFPVFNLDLNYGGIHVRLPACLVYRRWEDKHYYMCSQATMLVLEKFFIDQRPIGERVQLLPLLRWSGIYCKPLEAALLSQALKTPSSKLIGYPSSNSIYKSGYIPGVCLKCTMWVPGYDETKCRTAVKTKWLDRMGITSNGSIWCLHANFLSSQYRQNLCEQMEHVHKITGSPPRFSVNTWKCSLPKRKYLAGKRKLYSALVELGPFLGPGVDYIPPQNGSHDSGIDREIDFAKEDGDILEEDVPYKDIPTARTGRAAKMAQLDDPSGPRWNIAFATARCVHTWPANWSSKCDWPLQPAFTLGDMSASYVNKTFLPHEVKLVTKGSDIQAAAEEGRIPFILGGSVMEKRAIVQALGGRPYLLRECIHCAMPRVRRLMQTAGLVVIIFNGIDRK